MTTSKIQGLRCSFINVNGNNIQRCNEGYVKYKVSSPCLSTISEGFLKNYEAYFKDIVLSTQGRFEPSQKRIKTPEYRGYGRGMLPYSYVTYTHSKEEAYTILNILNKEFPQYKELHNISRVYDTEEY